MGKNDDIDGLKPNGQKVVLNGSGIGGNINGITLLDTDPTGSQVRNLVIQNFPRNGILAAHLNGAIFEGLDIHGNGGNGLVITYPLVDNANSRNVTVGGDQPQHRNLIYGNALNGIEINALLNSDHNGSQNIVIKNNYIGTSDGTTDNGNNGNGIELNQAFGVTIGDTTGATRNVISGNNNDGIQIKGLGATGNTIIGNFIGTDSSSGARLGNGASGISLVEGAGGNSVTGGIPVNRNGMPNFGNGIRA
ncbi:MAG TPA: hypothetical protein PKE69_23245, partial [Pyrinomonadaceae bacterium]|nr:hypothetical protein [Pyrinomonadaceae bacterium]